MNLQEPGQEFYDSVLAEFDFTGEPGKLAILERAARTKIGRASCRERV